MTQTQNQINEFPSTLLKFKALDDYSLDRIKKIITNKRIRCSNLWRLNDAMEGVYQLSINDLHKLDDIYTKKDQYFICSFTHPDSLESPLFWGYYANGFKGIAIEIKLNNEDKKYFKKVKYVDRSPILKNSSNTSNSDEIIEIITTKLKFWENENEYRYIIEENTSKDVYYDVHIKRIIIGCPYRNTANYNRITENSTDLTDYHKCRNELEEFCTENKIPFEHIPKKPKFN